MGACGTQAVDDHPSRARIAESSLSPMKRFSVMQAEPPAMANENIAADILALHFALESGRSLDRFTRFETPVTVQITGQPAPSMQADLTRLLSRLQQEAGIAIRQVSDSGAQITINAVPRDDIRRALPQAACFVVPNVTSLAEYRRDRRKPKTNWSLLERRERIGIFVPNDVSPQEIRDCLHEELAQALGPLNDLYRLPQSVFNDDNVSTVLTGFDMLVLRATYAPELRSGMTRAEVAAQLPGILARLNPEGARLPRVDTAPTPRSWVEAVQTTLGPGASVAARRRAAQSALHIAASEGWQDHRLAFSHYMAGRMEQLNDPARAQVHFDRAGAILRATPGTELHRAYIATQTAAYALATGNGGRALRQVTPALPVAERAENAALLSTLMLLKAEALDQLGRHSEARAVRLDSIGWARYGFGSDWAVRAKMKEISALTPKGRSS